MIRIKRAILSLSDKSGLIPLAEALNSMKIEILATSGTAVVLEEAGIEVTRVEEITGFSEMLGGRVKTLHPKIHAGILARRDELHLAELKRQYIEPIDLVVVNLYPFRETIKQTSKLERIIEDIDIGGVAMIRSAAKNFKDVVVIVSPSQYERLLSELKEDGGISEETSFLFACEAFSYTAFYDAIISNYLNKMANRSFPHLLTLAYEKVKDLRYGENPHQEAVLYKDILKEDGGIISAMKIQGKELSFNNILDLEAALGLVREFEEPAVAIIKHTNPCGVALGRNLKEAFLAAHGCDPVSAFGGVIGLNRILEEETALKISTGFVEAIIAPGFEEGALRILKKRENLRLLEISSLKESEGMDVKGIGGGILLQSQDTKDPSLSDLKVVSRRKPDERSLKDLLFSWKVVKHVKSNAIVLARGSRTVGIGGGQMSRIDAARIAIMKAGEEAKGSVLASDAFFPFRDVVDEAAKAGIEAIIQPGGSIRDEESIASADAHGIVMVFTGIRHFKH